MNQIQSFVTPATKQQAIIQHPLARRLLFSFLVGLALTVILMLLEAGFLYILNPFHMLGSSGNRFSALLALPAYAAGSLVLLGELLAASVATFLATQSLALIAYLGAVHRAQEESHKLYTPLTALTNIRRSVEAYQEPQTTAPTIYSRDERVSILDLVQQQEAHQLILGVPGAGKTMALRVFQYSASQTRIALALSRGKIPIYIPMKNYSLFLKQNLPFSEEQDSVETPRVTLFEYLSASDLTGMRYLKPYLRRLAEQGRLLLLCDGLNEIDSNYLTLVSEELVRLMRDTQNRVVMTCREVDYREQADFVQLVDEGQAARAVIYPLQPEQVYEFVELYVEKQDKHWKHTAGQIVAVIDRSRLRYHCTNPMMLFTLMGIIDKIGVERGKQIDTRGRLLREYVHQLIDYERRQAKWSRSAPTEQDVLHFLSEVACAARWANDRNAIQLHVSSLAATTSDEMHGKMSFAELADELRYWLDEHPARGPFEMDSSHAPESVAPDDVPQLVQFALSAALIEISPGGVLSFRHELIAEYFVAEYFFMTTSKGSVAALAICEDLLENVGRWSEPVAIWAGLLEKPLELAERFGALGLSNPASVLQALALGLVCVGVLWTPPQADIQRTVILPASLEEALSIAVRNRAAREELALIFTRCAEEGGQEVYRSLLPLIMVEGVDDLLILLDQSIVPEILFTQLQDAVDNIAYETQVKRLTRVLGRFGSAVVMRAAELSLPAPECSPRLRAAVINILGGTNDPHAVEPLIARLRDTEGFIVERATNALIRLGSALTLSRVLQELENRSVDPFTMRVHRATLTILGRFLDEQDTRRQVSLMQYQHILERIVPVLTSNYQAEPDVQQQACEILVRQGRNVTGVSARDHRWEKVIDALIGYLPSQNEVAALNVVLTLQEIGSPAVPRLLDLLNDPAEIVRERVVEILHVVRDLRALPALLHLLHDPAPAVQQQVALALYAYAPESIAGLIDLVLVGKSDAVAERAAQILASIGEQVVEPITAVLVDVVPGRTRLLVQVLEQVHDLRAVPALIGLLRMPQLEQLLAIALVRALGQFPDPQVVLPLLALLSTSNPQLYEEAITSLSQLGEVALPALLDALDFEPESSVRQRVRRAILGMVPFPGEALIAALEESSTVQAEQITLVFRQQGTEAADVLVRHLLHRDENVREHVYQTLEQMPGPIVVPALLEALHQQALRKIASNFLLKYPDAAIAPLVELLGENERGSIAVAILPQFGPIVLSYLIAGLEDQRPVARDFAHRIIVSLVRQRPDEPEIVHEIVHLFNPPPPAQAREGLIGVLTLELADVSLPALLEALEDAYLIDDVAECFVRLLRKPQAHKAVLDSLVESLYMDERRRGAEMALTHCGALAVAPVGALITDPQPGIANAAKQILCDIGVPALPFIWTAHSDTTNRARHTAAIEVFRMMRTDVIKDELVALLISDKRDEIAMAVALLLERIHDEGQQQYAEHVMVPELIGYVQTHTVESTNLRILALLLLLGERAIVDHLLQALDEYPQRRQRLTHMFLLLSNHTQQLLLEVFNDPGVDNEVRAELATVLGMGVAPDEITNYAQDISKYGVVQGRTGVLASEKLSIALHALGGLLASGHWNVTKLQELRDTCKNGDPAHELFNVLLGWRYEPQITKLQIEMDAQREKFEKLNVMLTDRLQEEQRRAIDLESDLEKMRAEHGFRGDELKQLQHDREALKTKLDQASKERAALQANLELAGREKATLIKQLERARQELQAQQAFQQKPGTQQPNVR